MGIARSVDSTRNKSHVVCFFSVGFDLEETGAFAADQRDLAKFDVVVVEVRYALHLCRLIPWLHCITSLERCVPFVGPTQSHPIKRLCAVGTANVTQCNGCPL